MTCKTPENKNFSKAFSLIEMMIALVVFSIVVGMIISFMVNFNRSVQKQQTNIMLGKECDAVFKRLETQLSSTFGWITGDSLGITLIETNGDSIDIYWNPRDSMLYQQTAAMYPQGVKVKFCRFYYMPRTAAAMGTKPETWLKEVDLDGNGIIEGLELKKAGLVVLNIKAVKNKAEYEGMKHFKLPAEIVDIRFLQ